MIGGIAREDLIMIAAFLGVVMIGVGYLLVRATMADSPRTRIRQRLLENVADVMPAEVENDIGGTVHGGKRMGGDSRIAQILVQLKVQADHMGGTAGVRVIGMVAVAAAVATPVAVQFLGFSPWMNVAVAPMAGALGGYAAFITTVKRYRANFLKGFPDALDLMIRAVRAGVPVVHAIITVGKELPYPVGREFRIMGDSLRLGMDQQDVMDAASKRIGIPDFRFFVVCLQLQRETGGPLADTLENLSSIIRARLEVRLKARALTAEGRAASKIIALVPFCVVGALKLVGGDYMDIMFDTERGQHLLWVAFGMVMAGLGIISRMSKLED